MVQFAENDLKAALKLANELNAITCFHCQQSAEKYIKGLLLFLQIDFKKSHDLVYLLELLSLEIPDDIFDASDYLNEYAVETRYPGDYEEITNNEATKAIGHTKLIKQFILKVANQNGYSHES